MAQRSKRARNKDRNDHPDLHRLIRVGLAGTLSIIAGSGQAGEGGGSNYLPGFYGDQALAVAPPDGFSLRNDLLFISGDASRTIKSGQIQADAGFDAVFNYLTLLYKPTGTFFGAD